MGKGKNDPGIIEFILKQGFRFNINGRHPFKERISCRLKRSHWYFISVSVFSAPYFFHHFQFRMVSMVERINKHLVLQYNKSNFPLYGNELNTATLFLFLTTTLFFFYLDLTH
jgi:hypothetical protein